MHRATARCLVRSRALINFPPASSPHSEPSMMSHGIEYPVLFGQFGSASQAVSLPGFLWKFTLSWPNSGQLHLVFKEEFLNMCLKETDLVSDQIKYSIWSKILWTTAAISLISLRRTNSYEVLLLRSWAFLLHLTQIFRLLTSF